METNKLFTELCDFSRFPMPGEQR